MKKEYIVPKATIARVDGQDDILKPIDFVGGSYAAQTGTMGAKERVSVEEDQYDDFWSNDFSE